MKKISDNILIATLQLLKVKHTEYYSRNYYENHPYKYNLYGLSMMFDHYGVDNVALQLEPQRLLAIKTPFIAFVDNDFVVVFDKTDIMVSFYWRGKDITIRKEQFFKIWSGIVLLLDPDLEKSGEPDYWMHQKEIYFSIVANLLLCFCFIAFSLIVYSKQQALVDLKMNMLLLLNVLGIIFTYVLVYKQLYKNEKWVDRVCSLFKGADCNSVLDSPASKVLNSSFTWSEVGISFYVSNVVILLLFPYFYWGVVIINAIILPYSFWSIWYQRYKVGQWCILCILSQSVFWLTSIYHYQLGFFSLDSVSILDIVPLFFLYLLVLLCVRKIVHTYEKIESLKYQERKVNSIRLKEEVFSILLNEEKRYDVCNSSSLVWGDITANIQILLVTNPYCYPCAKMHKIVDNIFRLIGDKICLRYVLSSFNNNLEETNKLLIAMYMHTDSNISFDLFCNWYDNLHRQDIGFLREYENKIDNVVQEEFFRQKKWLFDNAVSVSPLLIVNGFKFPEYYSIEDLKYFLEIDV
ncbi:vitamin K epoxide reductase family protein [Parabacteroides sp.]